MLEAIITNENKEYKVYIDGKKFKVKLFENKKIKYLNNKEVHSIEEIKPVLNRKRVLDVGVSIVFKDGFTAVRYQDGYFVKNVSDEYYPSIYNQFESKDKVKRV